MRQHHQSVQDQLIYHEGMRLMPYKCPAGKLTIGAGRNLEAQGISLPEALLLLKNDVDVCTADLICFFGRLVWESFSDGRQWALVDLRYNLGAGGFRMFKKMIHAIRVGDWAEAAARLKDSAWWNQVQESRRDTLYHQLYTGEA